MHLDTFLSLIASDRVFVTVVSIQVWGKWKWYSKWLGSVVSINSYFAYLKRVLYIDYTSGCILL